MAVMSALRDSVGMAVMGGGAGAPGGTLGMREPVVAMVAATRAPVVFTGGTGPAVVGTAAEDGGIGGEEVPDEAMEVSDTRLLWRRSLLRRK